MSQQDESAAPQEGGPGLAGRVQGLLTQGMELLQTRLELVSLELEAQKLRLFAALAQGFLALLLAAAALGMLSVCLLLLTPEAWRWLSALLLCLLFALAAWLLWRGACQQLRQPGGPFAASAEELSRDRSALES